jgi:cytochrome c oxidase subunit 2
MRLHITLCASIIFAVIGFIAGPALASEPLPWQMGFQEPAGSIAEKAQSLHDLLLIVITAISVFVLALLVYTCVRYRESSNPVPSKTSHNTTIEVLWTVIPVLILVVIAVPSFRLLYYMDETKNTDMVVKITGNQWYWNYEYPDEKIGFDSYIIDEADLAPGQPRL